MMQMSNSLLSRLATTVVVVAAMTASALAQEGADAPKVELKLSKTQVQASGQLTGTVTVTFAEGLHGYQNPPSEDFQMPVTVKVDGKTFKLIKANYPKGVDATMAGDPKSFKAYLGTVTIPVTLKAPAKAGSHTLKVVVSYQQCNDQSCFPPGDVAAIAKVKVVAAPKAKAKGKA
jgi:DsbC/DsbD-like thiol-disulfide interchange protein